MLIIDIIYPTSIVFFSAFQRFISMSALTLMWEKTNQTVASIFKKVAAEKPDKTAFVMEDKKITFKEVLIDFHNNQLIHH